MPWPTSDISIFNQSPVDSVVFMLTGASDLASPFLHPGCFWMAYIYIQDINKI